MGNFFINKVAPLLISFTILISFIYIGNFFHIAIGTYLGYLMWFVALLIMYYILPRERSSKFIQTDQ